MKAFLPNQPVTRDGHLPSQALLEALQIARRDETALANAVSQVAAGLAVAQGDIDALETGKADVVHTHAATDISDSTEAGRALLTAPDDVAQRTALGMGTIATQAADNIAVTGGSAVGVALGATTFTSAGASYLFQPAPTVIAAAATLTIAQLLTGIIQYTGAVATLTMPTGTDIDAGVLAGLAVDRAFAFSVINTGSGAATLATAAGVTAVGSLVVANGTSARFSVRKTAANTFVLYRL